MSGTEVKVLETKLDILIKDFQRFREGQDKVNKELGDHSSEENAVQSKILTTLRWHSIIGTGMATAIGYLFINSTLI